MAAIIRQFDRNSKADILLLESICKESGSKAVAKERAYIRRVIWETQNHPDDLWCEIYNDCAFWMAVKRKNYVRSVFTVVRADKHKQGIGDLLHRRRLRRCIEAGCTVLKMRTSQNERAIDYWVNKQNAVVVGLNGNDFELEFHLTNPTEQ